MATEQEIKEAVDLLVRDMAEARYGHMERRVCTAEHPMKPEERTLYRWGHPDAVPIEPFFNLYIYECPHCKLAFHSYPPENKQ
jgi:hypothetical protein